MSTIERIEYWGTCPGCGAPRSAEERACSYCGTSLVREREVMETEDRVEDVYAREDSFLPLVKGKTCAISSFSSTVVLRKPFVCASTRTRCRSCWCWERARPKGGMLSVRS